MALELTESLLEAGGSGVDLAQLEPQLGKDLLSVACQGRELSDGTAQRAVVDGDQFAVVLRQHRRVAAARTTHVQRSHHTLHKRHD